MPDGATDAAAAPIGMPPKLLLPGPLLLPKPADPKELASNIDPRFPELPILACIPPLILFLRLLLPGPPPGRLVRNPPPNLVLPLCCSPPPCESRDEFDPILLARELRLLKELEGFALGFRLWLDFCGGACGGAIEPIPGPGKGVPPVPTTLRLPTS